jgi:anti-sigma factor RsiW
MTSCRQQTYLGGYVLAALEPEEAEAVRAHLASCPGCQAEADSLRATAAMLAVLSLDDIDELTAPEVRTAPVDEPVRRPRRRGHLAVAAAALVLGVLGASGLVASTGDRPGPASPVVVQASAAAPGVRAAVEITSRTPGTELRLRLSGAYPGGTCYLVAHAQDGRAKTVASWVATARGTAVVSGRTAISRSDLSALDVVTASGQQLAHLVVPKAPNGGRSVPTR